MDSFTTEELALYVGTLETVLPPETRFVLILVAPDKCGVVSTCPPDKADEIVAVFAELGQRKPQFNN
jgi:hypothetical protein